MRHQLHTLRSSARRPCHATAARQQQHDGRGETAGPVFIVLRLPRLVHSHFPHLYLADGEGVFAGQLRDAGAYDLGAILCKEYHYIKHLCGEVRLYCADVAIIEDYCYARCLPVSPAAPYYRCSQRCAALAELTHHLGLDLAKRSSGCSSETTRARAPALQGSEERGQGSPPRPAASESQTGWLPTAPRIN